MKNAWSTNTADWGQRFEVGGVVADPSGSWTPGTAEAYIDQQVATLNTNITDEISARITGDNNLRTQLNSEMATRADQDGNLLSLIQAGLRDGDALVFDTVPTQNSANPVTSGGIYSTLRDSNIGFVDDEPTAGSDNLVKSGAVVNEIYSLIFNDIKDIKITKIQELYLTGLSEDSTYKCRLNGYQGAKDIYIFAADGITVLAHGTFAYGSIVKINERDNSGVNGYAVVRDLESVNILPINVSEINVKNVTNINISPTIKAYIDDLNNYTDYPLFNGQNKKLKEDGLAGKFFGYPFIIPTYAQKSNIIVSTLGELYLNGLNRESQYYIYYNLYQGSKYVFIYNNSKDTILARGLLNYEKNGVIHLKEQNSSGITGYLYYKGNPSDFATSNQYILLANEYCSDISLCPNIYKASKFLDLSDTTIDNVPILSEIAELYLEGLDSESDYAVNTAYNTDTQVRFFQIRIIGGTVVAQGIVNPIGNITELFPVNSDIHGYIQYNSEITSSSEAFRIAKNIVSDINNSPNIRLYDANNPISVGLGVGSYRFQSLLKAVLKASESYDKKIIVAAGTYDLEQEFKDYYGNDFFDNYQQSSHIYGLHLKNRMHLIFMSKAKVVFNYSGSNTDVKTYFSPFNADYTNSLGGGFTLENVVVEASNCRYCVHDERNDLADAYVNKYINCSMKIDNSNNSYGYPVCIGGGLGANGYIEISGCYFESPTYGVRSKCLASYHNSSNANAKSHIVVTNNYCAGQGTFKFSWHGTSTEITEILVTGNSVGNPIDVMAETEQSIVENINVIQWNNEVRS